MPWIGLQTALMCIASVGFLLLINSLNAFSQLCPLLKPYWLEYMYLISAF